jgi:MFS transporter, FHS family, Na+ dependent glucose transporter 1
MTTQPSLLDKRQKRQVTIGYYLAFISLGLVTAALGPALPYLAEQTGTALAAVSVLFVSRALGLILGALLSGRLYDRLPGHPIFIIGLVFITLAALLTPLPTVLTLLIGVTFLSGVGQSILNVGGNTLLIWLHGGNVAQWMNGLHFFYGLGSIFSPLLITWLITTTGSLTWAFSTIAGIVILPLFVLLRLPATAPQTAKTDNETNTAASPKLVLLIALFFFCYAGSVQAFGGWIYTYALEMDIAGPQMAGVLTSAFWAIFTLGRLLSIPIAARLRPQTILLGSLMGSLLSAGLLLLWPRSTVVIWLGTILFGLSVAPLFASTMSLAGQRMHISGRISSLFNVGISFGFLAMPWVVGQFFESVGPRILFVIILFTLLAGLAVFLLLLRSGRNQEAISQPTSS